MSSAKGSARPKRRCKTRDHRPREVSQIARLSATNRVRPNARASGCDHAGQRRAPSRAGSRSADRHEFIERCVVPQDGIESVSQLPPKPARQRYGETPLRTRQNFVRHEASNGAPKDPLALAVAILDVPRQRDREFHEMMVSSGTRASSETLMLARSTFVRISPGKYVFMSTSVICVTKSRSRADANSLSSSVSRPRAFGSETLSRMPPSPTESA